MLSGLATYYYDHWIKEEEGDCVNLIVVHEISSLTVRKAKTPINASEIPLPTYSLKHTLTRLSAQTHIADLFGPLPPLFFCFAHSNTHSLTHSHILHLATPDPASYSPSLPHDPHPMPKPPSIGAPVPHSTAQRSINSNITKPNAKKVPKYPRTPTCLSSSRENKIKLENRKKKRQD